MHPLLAITMTSMLGLVKLMPWLIFNLSFETKMLRPFVSLIFQTRIANVMVKPPLSCNHHNDKQLTSNGVHCKIEQNVTCS